MSTVWVRIDCGGVLAPLCLCSQSFGDHGQHTAALMLSGVFELSLRLPVPWSFISLSRQYGVTYGTVNIRE